MPNFDDVLMVHIDGCLAEEPDFALATIDEGWAATAGKMKRTGKTPIAATAALLTALRAAAKAKPAKG